MADIKIKDVWTKALINNVTTGYTREIEIPTVGTITLVNGVVTAFTPIPES